MKPYAKAQLIPLSGLADRRRRLTESQREEIREEYRKGDIGLQRLAKRYGVSKSLVGIIVNPERARKVSERFKAHWRDYAKKYGKAAHSKAVCNTRNYKYQLYKEAQQKAKSDGIRATP